MVNFLTIKFAKSVTFTTHWPAANLTVQAKLNQDVVDCIYSEPFNCGSELFTFKHGLYIKTRVPLERLDTFGWNSPPHPARTDIRNLLGIIDNSHMSVGYPEWRGEGRKYVAASNWLVHKWTSADY